MAIAGILNSVSNAASAASSQISGKDFQAYFKLRQPLIKQLGQALKSGDLTAAKEALDKLTALGTQNGLKNPFLRQDRAADFTAVAAALKSGDVGGAELAFNSLKQDLGKRFPTPQPVPPGVPPDVVVTIGGGGPEVGHGGGPTGVKTPAPTPIAKPPVPTPGKLPPVNKLPPAPAPPEVVVSINDVKGSGNPSEQIVLNLNGSSGAKGGEQINIGISQTSSGEQVSLSFGKASSSGSTPSVQLNLGSRPSEIDIAVSQTSAGEQIAISFKSAAQSAIQALTNGAKTSSESSSLSVSA